jgi:hypothetical protein
MYDVKYLFLQEGNTSVRKMSCLYKLYCFALYHFFHRNVNCLIVIQFTKCAFILGGNKVNVASHGFICVFLVNGMGLNFIFILLKMYTD